MRLNKLLQCFDSCFPKRKEQQLSCDSEGSNDGSRWSPFVTDLLVGEKQANNITMESLEIQNKHSVTWIYENFIRILCYCCCVLLLFPKYPIKKAGFAVDWLVEVLVLQLWFVVSHGVVKHHVLFGQLQQHRIVEELADTHILAQTLQDNKHKRSVMQGRKITNN